MMAPHRARRMHRQMKNATREGGVLPEPEPGC